MKPKEQPVAHSIAFLAALAAVIFLFLLRPDSLRTVIWEFPNWTDIFEEDSTLSVDQVQALLANYHSSDSSAVEEGMQSLNSTSTADTTGSSDTTSTALGSSMAAEPGTETISIIASAPKSASTNYDRRTALNLLHPDLMFNGNDESFRRLSMFFSKLNEPQRSPSLHVFHFGDSQIEGDRITGDLRSRWQDTWGGKGPGFLSPLQPIPSLAMKQTWSEGWNRYTRFGKVDSTIKHKRYGIMAAFSEYSIDADSTKPWIEFKPHPRSYQTNREFNQIQLAFGRTPAESEATIELNGQPFKTILLEEDSVSSFYVVQLPKDSMNRSTFQSLKLKFKGESPELNAIGFGSRSGISVHNIAMRGSSGTLFRQLDRQQLKSQLNAVRTELVMLQYGGNAVPYMKDSSAVRRYGDWFASQIRLFHSLVPNIPIVVIGPSDMATRTGTRMQTYPMLEYLVDVLKTTTISSNALYWDVFRVMGGRGSMAAWVSSTPPLASSDHVHFTPKGAREIAHLFDKSLQTEWALWQASQADQILTDQP